jgi:hypothetical protein
MRIALAFALVLAATAANAQPRPYQPIPRTHGTLPSWVPPTVSPSDPRFSIYKPEAPPPPPAYNPYSIYPGR